jgi:hypothetical protein
MSNINSSIIPPKRKTRSNTKKQNIEESKIETLNVFKESKSVLNNKNLSDWGLDIPLYLHQQNSVIKMENLEKNRNFKMNDVDIYIDTNVGILGDKTGSGKTLTIVSLLSRESIKSTNKINLNEKLTNTLQYSEQSNANLDIKIINQNIKSIQDNNTLDRNILINDQNESITYFKDEYKNNYEIKNDIYIDKNKNELLRMINSVEVNNILFTKIIKYKEKYDYLPINIIAVLPSVFEQWKNELEHSNLKCCFISKDKHISEFDINTDVILITYNRFNQLISHLKLLYINNSNKIIIKRLILDEITYDTYLNKIDSNFIWILTATNTNYIPKNFTDRQLRNSHLKYILNCIEPKYITIKNSDEIIEKSYKLPNIYDHIYECYSYYDNFSDVLSEEARNMLAADDLPSAIALLGGQQTNNSDLKEVILQKEKDNLHRLEARLKYYEELSDEKQIDNYKNKIDMNIKTIQNIEDRIKSMNNECPVCIEEIVNKIVVGCCTNAFCDKCILEILKTTVKCPLCRTKLDPSKMLYSNDQIKRDEEIEEKKKNCCDEYNDDIEIINQNTNKKVKNNKLKQLIKIVTSKHNGKFIVFSQYNNTFSHIIEELKNSNVSFCELKGSIDRINSILKQFDDGKIKVLFLNSKYNGTGINLQKTTDIIFYHKMSSIIEQQNIGRAMRIGRNAPLHIHRLITRNETIYNNN